MKFLTKFFVALLLVVGITFGGFHSDAHAASPLPINIKIGINDIEPIANRIKFDRKYTVLVANKTGKTLERVGAYNNSSSWPLGDIEPNAIVGQQFDGAPNTNSFSFASNYRVEPGKNIQLAATFPTIGRRKIGLGAINQDGNQPAEEVWDKTSDSSDKEISNPPLKGRASIQQKDGTIIWYYEVK